MLTNTRPKGSNGSLFNEDCKKVGVQREDESVAATLKEKQDQQRGRGVITRSGVATPLIFLQDQQLPSNRKELRHQP